jgi:hypothetical protein
VEGSTDSAAASSAGEDIPEPSCPSSTTPVSESLQPEQPSSSDQTRILRSQKEHLRLPQEKRRTKLSKNTETPLETLIIEIPNLGPGELILTSDVELPENTRVRLIGTTPQKPLLGSGKINIVPDSLSQIDSVLEINKMEGFEGLAMATWVNNIPDFKGEAVQISPNAVRNFIKKIETVAVTGKWSDEAKISVASLKLKGKALNFENSNKDMLDAIDNSDWETIFLLATRRQIL